MLQPARYLACFALALAAGCSTVEPEREATPCPEPPPCPVCKEPPAHEALCPVPEPKVVKRVVTVPAKLPPMATTAGEMHLPIIGGVESVTIEDTGITFEARVDTGAETSSMHAEDVRLVEKEGKRYVSFSLINPESGDRVPLEHRLQRTVSVRQGNGEKEKRYVVRLWVSVGELRARIDVGLSDRDYSDYPMLLGRNFLVDTAIVDVSREHLAGD